MDPASPEAQEAAEWAVRHLAGLSDSGVYESLTLLRVASAARQEGVYHANTLLALELGSPHLLDGAPSTTVRVVVMADLEDGVRSFAIDDFPVMEPAAIEEAWEGKVEAGRAAREVELRKLDDEFDANYVEICAEAKARAELREEGGFNEDDAPPPDPPHTDDDAPPPALDLGLGGASIMVDAPPASR